MCLRFFYILSQSGNFLLFKKQYWQKTCVIYNYSLKNNVALNWISIFFLLYFLQRNNGLNRQKHWFLNKHMVILSSLFKFKLNSLTLHLMHIFAIANIIYALKNTLYVTIFFFFLRMMVKLTDILKFLTR